MTEPVDLYLCMSCIICRHTQGREGFLMVPLQVPAVSAGNGGWLSDVGDVGRLGAYIPGQKLGRWGYIVMDGFLAHGVSPNFSDEPRKVICMTYRREVRTGGGLTDHQPTWDTKSAGPRPTSPFDPRTTLFHHILRCMYREGDFDGRKGIDDIMTDMGCPRS